MAAAAAEKHQRHQPATDDKGKERAEAKRDPAVFAHLDIAAGIPDHNGPHAGYDQQGYQGNNDECPAQTEVAHGDYPLVCSEACLTSILGASNLNRSTGDEYVTLLGEETPLQAARCLSTRDILQVHGLARALFRYPVGITAPGSRAAAFDPTQTVQPPALFTVELS
jgi:hypothetical protein